MKAILVFCFTLATVYSYPADVSDSSESSDDKPLPVPSLYRPRFNPSVVEIDVGSDPDSDEDSFIPSYFRPVFVNPFAGFRFGGFSDFFSRPSWFDSFSPKVNSWTKVKNATSSTKVVDGHKIVLNDTTYENEKDGSIFRFQVIEVSPVDSKEGTDNTSNEKTDSTETEKDETPDNRTGTEEKQPETPSGSSEEKKPDNNSADNEINNNKEETDENGPSEMDPAAETIDFGEHEGGEELQSFVDLTDDIKVNYQSDQTQQHLIMIPDDVELLPDTPKAITGEWISTDTRKQDFDDPKTI